MMTFVWLACRGRRQIILVVSAQMLRFRRRSRLRAKSGGRQAYVLMRFNISRTRSQCCNELEHLVARVADERFTATPFQGRSMCCDAIPRTKLLGSRPVYHRLDVAISMLPKSRVSPAIGTASVCVRDPSGQLSYNTRRAPANAFRTQILVAMS